MLLGGKVTALVCHLTKKVNKAEELTHLSLNIDFAYLNGCSVDSPIYYSLTNHFPARAILTADLDSSL